MSDDKNATSGGFLSALLDRMRGLRGRRDADERLREGLEELLEETPTEGAPEEGGERVLLENILEAHDRTVGEIMVPRADIIGVEDNASLDDLARLFLRAEHSRLPVWHETLDQVKGFVHIKDLLPYLLGREGFALGQIMREVLFVPGSMEVLDLLRKMRARRVHMAMVVDEFGGTDGLVTIEDLVEQIVGEIHDEHDEETKPSLKEIANGALEADGRCPVEDLEERLGLRLTPQEAEEHVETVGGLVAALAGRVPKKGETVRHASGTAFEVIDADPRRVRRVIVRPMQASNAA